MYKGPLDNKAASARILAGNKPLSEAIKYGLWRLYSIVDGVDRLG